MKAVAASSSRFPLLCLLGRHKPRPLARWNHGYYFTSCERCGLDLVRTAFSGWHEPRGYRVVWQAQPPARAVPAALERAGAQGAPPSGEELPI
ncbi:MAG: hypothetical protein QOE79_2909, partial [Sphingomonadales bacterium]|nr:hypothetical protein [Sphingomonadales bacterium]